MTNRDMIRTFVRQHGGEVREDEDIFATGRVNSLFAVQLVMWVESTFGMTVEGEDLNIANFRSISDIDRFVSAGLSAPEPAG